MNFTTLIIISFLNIIANSTSECATIFMQQNCSLNQAIQQDSRSESYELDYKFHQLIKNEDFIETKGYNLDLIFILKKPKNEDRNLNLELQLFRLNDNRSSLLHKERLTEEFKQLFIKSLPDYIKLTEVNYIDNNCKFVTYKIKLLACD